MNTQNNNIPPDWNVYEPEEAICVDTRLGKIPTTAGQNFVLIMELEGVESGNTLIKFFNCERLKSGHYSVKRNSDFAKLYRLATGDNPKYRFSKAEQLLKHLRVINFKCAYVQSESDKSGRYFKVKAITPVNPIFDDEWFKSGKQRQKPHRKRQPITVKQKPAEDINRTTTGYELDKTRIKTGYSLDMPIARKASHINVFNPNSIPLPHLTSQDNKVEPSSHTLGYTLKDVSEKERIIHYESFEDETEDEYWDRIITNSLTL